MILIMLTDHRQLFEGSEAINRRLRRGDALFQAGDAASQIALVREGEMHLLRSTSAGATVILQTAGPGEILAEASAYSDIHHCRGVAAQATLVTLLTIAGFRRGLTQNPDLAEAWAAHLARSVQSARMLSEIRTLRTVAERVDAWVGEGGVLPARGHWQELASELGVTREALYRELARRR
jgi:CRP/FNR family transcriptional regulator, dissimilatory nitrate respiration regulator